MIFCTSFALLILSKEKFMEVGKISLIVCILSIIDLSISRFLESSYDSEISITSIKRFLDLAK